MSVFTYHLIEALTGHAQPQEGASEVLVSDLMGHVTRHVQQTVAQWGHVQTPLYQTSGDNFPVALLLGGEGLSKGVQPPDPLQDQAEMAATAPSTRIDTGGGMFVRGSVVNRGVIVGRDQHVGGDFVMGNKVSDGDDRTD